MDEPFVRSFRCDTSAIRRVGGAASGRYPGLTGRHSFLSDCHLTVSCELQRLACGEHASGRRRNMAAAMRLRPSFGNGKIKVSGPQAIQLRLVR